VAQVYSGFGNGVDRSTHSSGVFLTKRPPLMFSKSLCGSGNCSNSPQMIGSLYPDSEMWETSRDPPYCVLRFLAIKISGADSRENPDENPDPSTSAWQALAPSPCPIRPPPAPPPSPSHESNQSQAAAHPGESSARWPLPPPAQRYRQSAPALRQRAALISLGSAP